MQVELEGASARHPAARADARAAIVRVGLRIQAGEQVAVIGPSGAGKTTLLQVMAAALPPAEGRVRMDGQEPWSLPRERLRALRARLVLAPQVPPLPPRQRVVTAVLAARLAQMGLLFSLRSLFRPHDIGGAHEALARFDVADKLFDRVDRLSGGERQRVGLARALLALRALDDGAGPGVGAGGASLLLVDEPLSALDPTRARQALDALVRGAAERGATLVATLHQVDMALSHFPRVIGLRDGAVAFDLPSAQVTRERLAELYAQHEHELRGDPAPASPAEDPAAPAPPAMHCR